MYGVSTATASCAGSARQSQGLAALTHGWYSSIRVDFCEPVLLLLILCEADGMHFILEFELLSDYASFPAIGRSSSI